MKIETFVLKSRNGNSDQGHLFSERMLKGGILVQICTHIWKRGLLQLISSIDIAE